MRFSIKYFSSSSKRRLIFCCHCLNDLEVNNILYHMQHETCKLNWPEIMWTILHLFQFSLLVILVVNLDDRTVCFQPFAIRPSCDFVHLYRFYLLVQPPEMFPKT